MDELEAWVAARLDYLVVKRGQKYLGERKPVEVRKAKARAVHALKDFKKALDREGISYKESDEKDS